MTKKIQKKNIGGNRYFVDGYMFRYRIAFIVIIYS